MGIATIDDAVVSWTGSFGVKNSETGEPVTDDTVFCAASVSKPISAYLALTAWSQGVLDLDEGIGHILEIDDPELGSITPRQLLSHTSGLPNWLPGLAKRLAGGPVLPGTCALSAPPGERYIYSGEGYFWLQRVIERIAGLPFDVYAEQQLFARIGMNQSSFVWRPDYDGTGAYGHNAENVPADLTKRMKVHAYPNAAASLHTTPRDLGTFVCHLMASLPEVHRAIGAMLTPQITLSDQISWALGWGVEVDSAMDGPWYWHHGRGQFTNLVMWSQKRGMGIVVLTNTKRSEAAESLAHQIVRLVTGVDHPAFDFMPFKTMQRMGFSM